MRYAHLLPLILLLAGCTDAADPLDMPSVAATTESSAPSTSYDFDAGVPAPTWHVGDWWQYQVEFNSGEKYLAKIVVYQAQGSSYLITADNRDLILRATFNHYPNIGPVNKDTLSQTIHGTEVSYFRFPMKNGTWQAQYRDFEAKYETQFTMLPAGTTSVPGFVTTLRNAADDRIRMTYGWSPVTKWFTDVAWDFDGTGPVDVTYRLKSWGSNHTGALPLVELVEGVHRPFPTLAVPPNTQGTAPDPRQSTAAFKITATGSTLIYGIFAGAGGTGLFEYGVANQGSAGGHQTHDWRPNAAGAVFKWHKVENPAVGDWHAFGTGAAQTSSFLFLEAYEARTTQITV